MYNCYGWFDEFNDYCCVDCPYGDDCYFDTYGYDLYEDDYPWY